MAKSKNYDAYQNASVFWKGKSYNVRVTSTKRVWLSNPFNALDAKPLSKKDGGEVIRLLDKSF